MPSTLILYKAQYILGSSSSDVPITPSLWLYSYPFQA